MSQFMFARHVHGTSLSHIKRFMSRSGTKGDMPDRHHTSPAQLAPIAAADATLAPAPMPVPGELDPGRMPLGGAGAVLPPTRDPARAAGPTRDRADNRLFERFAATRALGDRDAIVERFLPLARQLAASYHRPLEPFDDVFQAACYGLVKAVDRFEPDRGRAFTSDSAGNSTSTVTSGALARIACSTVRDRVAADDGQPSQWPASRSRATPSATSSSSTSPPCDRRYGRT